MEHPSGCRVAVEWETCARAPFDLLISTMLPEDLIFRIDTISPLELNLKNKQKTSAWQAIDMMT